MPKVFVFEYLSAGGVCGADDPSLLAQGVAMRDALVADLRRAGCTVAGADRANDESPFALLARQCERHDLVWVIAPESDGLLERLHRRVGAARWIGCDAASIRTAASKRATLDVLAAHAVATPRAYGETATRWVVKPDDGCGAVDTFVHASRADADADCARRNMQATLEPWVEGEPLSLSLLCGHGEAELLSVNRQRIAIGDAGRVAYQGVDIDVVHAGDARRDPLAELAARVARALPGLKGYAGVDLVWHAGHGPVAIEVNPRLTCAYVGLSAALGRNIAAEVLALHG